MRLTLHWLVFLALLCPLLLAGLERLHYTHFGVFVLILVVVTLLMLLAFLVAERLAPTLDDDNEGSNSEEQ